MRHHVSRMPTKKTVKILDRDSRVLSPSMTRDYPYVFEKGKGCIIWDVDGRKHIDFAASIAVMNAGYCVPSVVNAVKKQMERGSHCAFPDFYAEVPVRYAETLLSNMPVPLNKGKVFFSNSGTEAVECALKLAKWTKRRPYAIAFNNCFHGRTMGSLSMTYSKPIQREGFDPFLPVKHVPYPHWYQMKMSPEDCSQYCLDKIEQTIKQIHGQASCLFLESIQGEGGYVVPPKSFIKGVRRLCSEHDILLCDDEVQAGTWRTGKFLAIENFKVQPDIVSMAKAAGGGMPLGVTVAEPGLMKWPGGSHSNTFGGNLIACAAGTATLNYMKEKKLGKNAVKIGKFMQKRLKEMENKYECVGNVRGIGLMIGIEIVHDKHARTPAPAERDFILHKAYEGGLVMLGAGESVLRICPPLVITKEQAGKGLDILEKAIKMLHERKR